MQKYKILIVDDEEINREILKNYLQDDYTVELACNGKTAIDRLQEEKEQYLAILLDLSMPEMDGFAVIKKMKEMDLLKLIPVIVITGEKTRENEKQCFEMGATEFVEKPFDPYLVRKRVENIVKMSVNQRYLAQKVDEQTKRLRKINSEIINAMGELVEFRDLESGEHIKRVKKFTGILAEYVRREYPEYKLTEKKVYMIEATSPLHDLGKIAISDAILNKPGRFTKEEFEEMKQHTVRGANMLRKFSHLWDKQTMKTCYNICLYHHEKYDGKGYPEGLKGEEIPIEAQIVAVADCYDALVNKRVYKEAYGKDTAYQMIQNGECGVFSDKILHCFELAKKDFEYVMENM